MSKQNKQPRFDAPEMLRAYQRGANMTEIAAEYGYGYSSVQAAVVAYAKRIGLEWEEVKAKRLLIRYRWQGQAETWQDQVYTEYMNGYSLKEIAMRYKTSSGTVYEALQAWAARENVDWTDIRQDALMARSALLAVALEEVEEA